MNIPLESVKKEIETHLSDVRLRIVRDTLLLENPQALLRVALYLKETPALRLDYLSCITASDFLDHLESIYHFYSMEKKIGPVVIRVRLPRKNARVPSLMPVYKSADYQEREAFDLFGIVYEGHPDLRRLFLWDEFQGHPLLKDYEQEDVDVLETKDVEWLEAHHVKVPEAMKEKANALKEAGARAVVQKPVEPRPI
jgi:NADH:ubiquinone oxidoreductase subunit C